MKINGNEIRSGSVIEYDGRIWLVLKHNIVSPGKGGAFNQVEMRDIKTGAKSNQKFRSDETVERLRVEEKEMQFLYAEGDHLTFMDRESYDQITVERDMIGEAADFLAEGMTVTAEFIDNAPVGIQLPQTAVLTVVEADAVVRGQTAASSYKPAMLDNGVKIMVPAFVGPGTKIVVNVALRTYVERAKD
ncbi:MAG: elongation factor P [Pseudomonadota bacterium]